MTVALDAVACGQWVFPLWPRTKVPALHGEHNCPRTGACAQRHLGWEERATRDPELIRYWWRALPMNVAIATGPSGLHVLDLDAAHGIPPPQRWAGAQHGRDVLARVAEQAGAPYPGDTRIVRTPSVINGEHLYFQAPSTVALRSTVGRVGWRIDTRGIGGYIVAAGSVRSGGLYRVVTDRPVAPLPGWLIPLLTPPPMPTYPPVARTAQRSADAARTRAYLQTVVGTVAAAEPGTRHDTLLRAAFTLGRLVAGGEVSDDEARAGLHTAAAHWRGSPHRKDLRTIEDGLRAGSHHPRRLAA